MSILGYSIGGLVILWVLYQLYWFCIGKVQTLEKDDKIMKRMDKIGYKTKSRLPLFKVFVRFCCRYVEPDVDETIIEDEESDEKQGMEVSQRVTQKVGSQTARTPPPAKKTVIQNLHSVHPKANIGGAIRSRYDMANRVKRVTYHSMHNPTLSAQVEPDISANADGRFQPYSSKLEPGSGDSDDSSFLSDIINAMIEEDSASSSAADSDTRNTHSVSTSSFSCSDSSISSGSSISGSSSRTDYAIDGFESYEALMR